MSRSDGPALRFSGGRAPSHERVHVLLDEPAAAVEPAAVETAALRVGTTSHRPRPENLAASARRVTVGAPAHPVLVAPGLRINAPAPRTPSRAAARVEKQRAAVRERLASR